MLILVLFLLRAFAKNATRNGQRTWEDYARQLGRDFNVNWPRRRNRADYETNMQELVEYRDTHMGGSARGSGRSASAPRPARPNDEFTHEFQASSNDFTSRRNFNLIKSSVNPLFSSLCHRNFRGSRQEAVYKWTVHRVQ